MDNKNKFKLARMHPVIAGITWGYLALTLWFAVKGPLGVAGFLAVIAGVIWCWYRPSFFEVDPEGLRIRWPWRQRWIPKEEILSVEALGPKALGFAVRVGAGGLWGTFGYFYSTKLGGMNGYVSAREGLLLLRLKGKRPLLITPERPEEFIEKFRRE